MIKKRILKKNKPKISAGRIAWYFVAILFLGAVGYVFLFSPWFWVARVEFSGFENLNQEEISQKISSEMEGKYFGIFDRRNIWLLRVGQARRDFLGDYPILEGLKIKKIFPDALRVEAKERQPGIIIESSGEDLAIDQKGIVYDRVDLGNLDPVLQDVFVIHDLSERKAELKMSVVNEKYIQYLIETRKRLKDDFDIELQNKVETPSIVSFDVRFLTTRDWRIFLDQSISLEKELEMLRVVLENKIPPEERGKLEYIDLRLDNKVYYKFKDGTQIDSEIKPEETSANSETVLVKEEIRKDDKKKEKKK